jgi:hypothetical protein
VQAEFSFGRQVIKTAWANSRTLLKSRLQSGLIAFLSLIIGIGAEWAIAGLSPTMSSILATTASTFAVAAGLFALKFAWHLFLAPSEIVYGAIRLLLESTPLYGVARPTNYAIWKWKRTYVAGEFAALLAGIDPSSPASTLDSQSYLRLILDDLRTNDLKYGRPPGMGPDGIYNPDIGAVIAKDDALTWAEMRGFDLAVSLLRDHR